MVAIIPREVYEQLVAALEARFEILDRIRDHLPQLPVEEVQQDALVVPGSTNVSDAIPAHRADEKILACALDGEANLIVSGDPHLLDLGEYRSIPIRSVRQFLTRLETDESG